MNKDFDIKLCLAESNDIHIAILNNFSISHINIIGCNYYEGRKVAAPKMQVRRGSTKQKVIPNINVGVI